MDADDYALRVVGALKQKQQKQEHYPDQFAWREAWWAAWLGYIAEHRAAFEASISAKRAESERFQQRLDANTDFPTVRPSLEDHIDRNRPVIRFWALLTSYLDADKESARRIAGELAAHANTTLNADWIVMFFYHPRQSEKGEYRRVFYDQRWRVFSPEINAGAFAVRMGRIADKGSALPLDEAEATIMALKEHRFSDACVVDRYRGPWYRGTYQYLHHILQAEKNIALIDALVQIYDAEQIGDTAGAEAGRAAFEAADKLFGGNFKNGRTVWLPQLTEDERAAWEAWVAETGWQEYEPRKAQE